ncbi:hypothetical protein [Mucilaginibacter sp. L3T2-6]|uniref:hypothetical protein n=1 Tax=Mucilaginibacter sp. L3T2-6 TaxID=3062491 RepID=UPI00267633A4|nr:hypothetical protein [Mucilaginibacter sp. L3T2-6]MDO3641907.1 hypothetical protein [Mucilaginibacter sp. L3T2-6]MDV6214415.1 hypothetical protein [Mucilaginibacter sp. L3T2-6]
MNEPTPGWPPSFCLYARARGLLTDDPNYLNENNTLLIPFLRNLGQSRIAYWRQQR